MSRNNITGLWRAPACALNSDSVTRGSRTTDPSTGPSVTTCSVTVDGLWSSNGWWMMIETSSWLRTAQWLMMVTWLLLDYCWLVDLLGSWWLRMVMQLSTALLPWHSASSVGFSLGPTSFGPAAWTQWTSPGTSPGTSLQCSKAMQQLSENMAWWHSLLANRPRRSSDHSAVKCRCLAVTASRWSLGGQMTK